MKLIQIEAKSLMNDNHDLPIDEEVSKDAKSVIGAHLKLLGDFWTSRGKSDPNQHLCLLAIDETKNKAVAYRYFYFDPNIKHCELFATYVSSEYRRRGIAKNLFRAAIERGEREGCDYFIIRFASPNEERCGLVGYYQQFARKNATPSKRFSIYFCDRHIPFPAQQFVN